MNRSAYFIRRLLLVIPTFLGITLLCFTICQFVPGGPVEQMLAKMRGGDGALGGEMSTQALTEAQREAIEEYFGFDQPILKRYVDWLVVKRMGMTAYSYKFNNKTVWELVKERFPVSLTFGLAGFILSYLICIPLGISKAVRNGSAFDLLSSVLVFIGYAIPGFVFGMLLRILFAGTSEAFFDWFPLGGFRSDDFDTLSLWGKIKDQFDYMFLPVLCYIIGNFAVLTLLMKNSLLDQIGQDYVRTVLAKGGSLNRALWGHALRNALIPIATGFGSIMTLMFAGSVLIEKVFNIPGMGLLSLEAIIGRDYMVFMGILGLTALLGLIGRIFSDLCYVLIDPRIHFGGDGGS
jgi:microcin C transport system permease protein